MSKGHRTGSAQEQPKASSGQAQAPLRSTLILLCTSTWCPHTACYNSAYREALFPLVWAREASQINLEGNQTMRRNPLPDQAEMHFLMGKSPHVCSKERGRGKWIQTAACPEEETCICLPCSSLASNSKLYHPLHAELSNRPTWEGRTTNPCQLTSLLWLSTINSLLWPAEPFLHPTKCINHS